MQNVLYPRRMQSGRKSGYYHPWMGCSGRCPLMIATTVVGLMLAGCGHGGGYSGSSESTSGQVMMKEAVACLEVYINTLAPQTTIENGLKDADDTGRAVTPVLTRDQSGHYTVNQASPLFGPWVEQNQTGWPSIQEAILRGRGCPYTYNG